MEHVVALHVSISGLKPNSVLHRFDSAHATFVAQAQAAYAAGYGTEAPPCAVLIWPDLDRVGWVFMPWRDEFEQDAMLCGLEAMIRADGVGIYSIVGEMWTAEIEPEDVDKPLKPDDYPDRQERLHILTCTRGREPLRTSFEILPGRKLGAPVHSTGLCGGRMTDLFGETGRTMQ